MELVKAKAQNVPLFRPTKKIRNRRERRAYENEIGRNRGFIDRIEDSFLKEIFDVTIYEKYLEIYLRHLEWFLNMVRWMGKNNKFTCSEMNADFFKQMYQPDEKEFCE